MWYGAGRFRDGGHTYTRHIDLLAVLAAFEDGFVEDIDELAFTQIQYRPDGLALPDEPIAQIEPKIAGTEHVGIGFDPCLEAYHIIVTR